VCYWQISQKAMIPNDGIIFKEVVGDFPRLVKKVFATNTTATDIVIDL
jgi:hypothetical protein